MEALLRSLVQKVDAVGRQLVELSPIVCETASAVRTQTAVCGECRKRVELIDGQLPIVDKRVVALESQIASRRAAWSRAIQVVAVAAAAIEALVLMLR
jgi:hypothetical protein